MSSTKRKQKPPERFCEEKRAKMTWTLYDMVSSSYDQPAATFSTSSASLEDTRRGSLSARRNKKQAGEPKNLELNLDNTLSQHSFCQLGVFNIGLCISKKQQDEVRSNGTNNGFSLSSPNLSDEQCYNGEHPAVIVNLSFETVDFFDENSTKDEVRQVSFRAVVPCHVSKDKLEALVYLQNKGVISLVLSPEQRILKDFWEVIVCLNESGLTKLPVASVDSSNRKTDKLMKLIMAWFYNLSLENDLAAKDYDDLAVEKGFDELYDGIKAIREKVYSLNSAKSSCCDASVTQKKCNKCNGELSRPNGLITTDFQHPNLKPVLRGYQRRAVDWMLKRELGCQLGNQDGESGIIHPLWQEVHTLDGKLIYFNPHTGRLTKERFPLPSLPLGGILADEMGLGKTVEVIACILHHPKPLPDCKSLIDNRTANQKLIASQANGQNPVMSCVEEMFTSSTHAQGNQSHQGQTNNSTIKPAYNSHVDSQTTHPCSNNNPMNAANRVACSVQESCSNSQHSECEINNEEGRNQSMVKSGHKILDDARIAPHHSSLCHSYKLSMTETNKSDIQKCSESCEILSQEGTHDSTVKSNQKVDERNCDSELTTCRKGGNHKVVGTVGGENDGSIHNNTIFSKNDCDLPEVNSSQSSNSYSIVLESPGDSGCSNAGTISGKKDSSVFASDESLCSCKNPDSSKTVFCKLHSGTRSENLSNPNDQSKDLSKIQVALEVNSLACASHEPTEHKGTIKCQCICGASAASYDDRPLRCCGCQAIFHAKCLQYECPQEFVCPQCALKRPAVPSRATLIISPAPIAQQWVDEIWRHTEPSSLKLLVYEGVAKSGFILPEVLADHDVILTTYSTLRSDFYHLGSKSERSMRYDKRYVALPSPLTGVLFWRICLDEAQMVESTTAKAAEVALHLSSVHRWCVTGTPIQKGLADIYGLLLFLGVDPYCNQRWWKALLYEPYRNGQRQPLYNVLAKIMWRSAKKDVIHEIQLPAQDETVKWLTFSPVEQHFYRRQHEECAGTAMRMLGNWEKTDTMLSTIDRHTVHQLLNPLLRLRQACCHPQAVRGGYLSMQKSTLTMDKLLESLISKAKLECEEAHRQLLFAFNGLAGVHILKEEWPEAVDMYREAMRSWTEHEATFRTDGLQKLHTLFNLSDILRHHQEVCSRTLRDEKLQDEVKELKSNYTTRVNAQVTAAQESLDVAKSNIAEIKQKVDFQSPWWMGALHYMAASGLDGDLCHRIKDELSSTDMELGSIGRFTDLRGLQYLLSSKLDLIETTHNNLVKALDKLTVMPSTQMVQASAECCLRPAKDSHADRCAFCEVDDIFTEYESRIFGHQGMKGVDEEDLHSDTSLDWHRHGNTGGLRAESEVEKVLRIIHSFIKTNKIAPDAVQEGRHHLNLIESLRKEFKFLRALWFALHERVSCLDELDMCTTRLRLLLPGEPVTDDVHVIHPLQVDQQRLKFVSDRLVAQTELRKKIGQLLYLNNLAKTQTCHGGKNPEPCPVCVKQLGVQWSVFSCGHCICCQCAWVLLRQAGIGPRHRNVHVKCPMCRIPTVAQEISYVSTARTQTEEAHDSVTVKGSHSTKIEAIVRTLLSIKSTDSEAKCLVFSTWQDVLAVLAKALDENGIKYRHIIGSRHFQMNLQTFKQDPLVGVLLLPLQTGSNGLNITEATHVLLVEPALNPAHELQAVGRVHRIGQTKPTHVHRFIIRGTVESRMHSLLQSKPTGCVRTGARDSENSSLTLGDLASLFTQDDDEVDEQCMTGTFGLQDGCEPSVAQH